MRGFRLSLCLGAVLVLGACGKQQTAEQAPATPPATALAPPASTSAPSATATQRQEVGLAPAPANKIAKLNEDGSESGGDTTADTGSGNRLLAAVARHDGGNHADCIGPGESRASAAMAGRSELHAPGARTTH